MVLGFLLTVLVIILIPRGEILRGAPDRGRLSVVFYVFHFLIIAPTVDAINTGNEWRTEEPLKEEVTGL